MTEHMRASSFLILGVCSSWLRDEEQGRVQRVLSSCRETVCFSLRIQSWGSKHTTLLEFAQQSTEPTELHRAPIIWCEETIQGQKRDIGHAPKFTKWQNQRSHQPIWKPTVHQGILKWPVREHEKNLARHGYICCLNCAGGLMGIYLCRNLPSYII